MSVLVQKVKDLKNELLTRSHNDLIGRHGTTALFVIKHGNGLAQLRQAPCRQISVLVRMVDQCSLNRPGHRKRGLAKAEVIDLFAVCTQLHYTLINCQRG